MDILKVPHHGSDRNVTVDFFRKVHASNYAFSGNGRHDNPTVRTLEMLFEARPTGDAYTIHWTYAIDKWKSGYPKTELQAVLSKAADQGLSFTATVIASGQSIEW